MYKAPEPTKLRVWWINNPPNQSTHFFVDNVKEAIIKLLTLSSIYVDDEGIHINAGGLEGFCLSDVSPESNGWSEYYNHCGDDIDNIIEEIIEYWGDYNGYVEDLNHRDETRKFINWLMSDEGDKIYKQKMERGYIEK